MMYLIQLFFISLCITLVSGETPLFENQSVIKTVDLSEAVVKVTLRFSIKPMEQTLTEYYVGIPKSEMDHLAFISSSTGKSMKLTIKKADVENDEDIQLFKVISKEPFEEKSVIFVEYYLTHVLESLPAFAAQDETPLFVYRDTLLVQSPYLSNSQEIRYKLPQDKYESISDISPKKVRGDTVTYGPFKDVSPFVQSEETRIHFPSKAQFRTLEKVEREIEVSHWGNVAVEEVVHARNSGTPLQGEFSRLDYYRSDPDDTPSWERLTAHIDKRAKDIYYRDIIGNITTSNVRRVSDSTLVELNMRFPMMGGWKTEFYWGYNLPSNRVLKKQGSRYSLTIPFSSPLENCDMKELSVRVILPECVKNVKFSVPEGVSQPTLDRRYTYLDTRMEGRHVYEFKRMNLVEQQKEETLTVSYDLNPLMLWREPLMCIAPFVVLFMVKAVLKRISQVKEKRD